MNVASAPSSESPPSPARIRFRQPVSSHGYVDAAWWPRSRDLTVELPPLLEVLWTASRDVNRITYHLRSWDVAPRRMQIEGRKVHLGGYATGSPITVRLTDAWGVERIDVLVIDAKTDPDVAKRAMQIASEPADALRADEILERAATSSPDGRTRP